MSVRRRGAYPTISSTSVIDYLDKQIQKIRIGALEAKQENNETRFLLYEGARIILEDIKEDVLYSIGMD